MARKEIMRIVNQPPLFQSFKPTGIASKFLNQTILSLDEYEALRLADYDGMTQAEAADEMQISRPTFTRLIEKARQKMVEFLIKGNQLTIDGGNIHFSNNVFKFTNCAQTFILNINETVNHCPSCESEQVINIAGNYGHGKCCVTHKNERR